MNWKPELDELARREALARAMGGVDKVKRQRDQGRLTVRASTSCSIRKAFTRSAPYPAPVNMTRTASLPT
jgi:hypothetical protein